MASSSRPVRNRNQPSRNKDNVELNLQLIQRLEANRINKLNTQGTTNYAKLLASFINSVNEHYRVSLTKIENQRKDQNTSKGKLMENGDNAQWTQEKDKKKYAVPSGSKITTRTLQTTKPQQQMRIEKNYYNDRIKYGKNAKNLSNPQDNLQRHSKSVLKQQKKVIVTVPPPQQPATINKPFRRSSYHIGIAYTIYMAQMKDKNPQMDPRVCDPTIYARKLKTEQDRQSKTPHKRQMKFIQQNN